MPGPPLGAPVPHQGKVCSGGCGRLSLGAKDKLLPSAKLRLGLLVAGGAFFFFFSMILGAKVNWVCESRLQRGLFGQASASRGTDHGLCHAAYAWIKVKPALLGWYRDPFGLSSVGHGVPGGSHSLVQIRSLQSTMRQERQAQIQLPATSKQPRHLCFSGSHEVSRFPGARAEKKHVAVS